MRLSIFLCLFSLGVPGVFSTLAAEPSSDFLRLAEWAIIRQADRDLADERALYWRKCTLALKSRRDSRNYALRGVALFLATVPVEYTISRHRHIRKTEPVILNATAFVLMGATLFQLTRSYQRWEHYERDRPCCRLWQEYAKPPTAKVAAADPPCERPSEHASHACETGPRDTWNGRENERWATLNAGPSRPFHLAHDLEEGH